MVPFIRLSAMDATIWLHADEPGGLRVMDSVRYPRDRPHAQEHKQLDAAN